MFQTELVQFLQSFATDWLTAFMLLVSRLGYSSFYIPVLIAITFGLDFRKGFLLIQMMLWMGLITDGLKHLIALPRPVDIDSGVKLLQDGMPNPTPFTGMGGSGFWDLPDRETIEVIRSQPEWSFGLPSGHVSGTTTFWGGLALLFPHTALKVLAPVMVVLMALSRMYLGRHFLADVLAGFLLGAVFLVVIYSLFIRAEAWNRLVELVRRGLVVSVRFGAVLALALLTPLALLALNSLVDPGDVGVLFGLNLAFVVLALKGLPDDAGSWRERTGRVVLALALFLVAARLADLVLGLSSLDQENRWVAFLGGAMPAFAALWGGVIAGQRLGLYTRKQNLNSGIG